MTDKASNVDLLARIAELEHECERLQGEFDYAHADSTNEVTREALYRAEIANLKAIVDGTWVCGFLSNLRQAIGDTEGKLDLEEIPKAVADLKRRLEDAELIAWGFHLDILHRITHVERDFRYSLLNENARIIYLYVEGDGLPILTDHAREVLRAAKDGK